MLLSLLSLTYIQIYTISPLHLAIYCATQQDPRTQQDIKPGKYLLNVMEHENDQ